MFVNAKSKLINKIISSAIIALLATAVFVILSLWDLSIHRFMPRPNAAEGDFSTHFAPFKPTKEGYSVFVDLDSMMLTLYEDSKKMKSWQVSGGNKETPSPTGSWKVTGIGNWGEGFGGSWIAINVPWGKYGIHGTVEPWAIGKNNLSHGCIRMRNEDVAELKKHMSYGTPVYIKYDNAPFRIIKDGKVGSDVLKLQIMLKRLGYYDGTPDGSFGGETFDAVRLFQSDEQIKIDGVVGKQSWDILNERILKLKFK